MAGGAEDPTWFRNRRTRELASSILVVGVGFFAWSIVNLEPEESRLRQAASVVSQRVGDGVLLLAPGSSEALHLDAVGARIWDGLAVACTVQDLVSSMAQWYTADPDKVGADVWTLVSVLLDHGAVVRFD